MFLFHASTSLSFLLLFLQLSSILLTKLFTFLCHKATSKGNVELNTPHDEYDLGPATATDEYSEKEDLVADVIGGETLLFLYKESANNGTLLVKQGKDSKDLVSFEEEDSLVSESAYGSPLENLAHEKLGIEYNDVPIINVSTTLDSEDVALEDKISEEKNFQNTEETKDFSKDERLLTIENSRSDSEKFQVEKVHEDKENFGGSLTGDSTSKSSVEWRSSTIFRDSETEYPFSSSSRRSSSNWESYTVFRKYNEEMLFFDRITAQKLSETESLRSIKVHPRSISERIVHKLTTKPKNYSMGRRDPYQELESAYVAQICLTWEALNWNYTNFRLKNSKTDTEGSGCPARIAQQFQQFQVLVQRFIENEPYEYGRRPEVYARRRISSPKLLQVPEFRDSEADEGVEDMSSKISSAEFLVILEDAIRTFMRFLKADKEKCSDIIRGFIKKKKASSVYPTFLRFLKKSNKKKKLRLKDLGRQHRCIRKRRLNEEEEMEILMGLIDMKVVSRVLRNAEISDEQLHWCEEKMGKVRVWDGKMQRDSSPLFFPVH